MSIIQRRSAHANAPFRLRLAVFFSRCGVTTRLEILVLVLAAILAPASGTSAAQRAQWIEDAVVYGVIPRYFGPHGLADVTARLDKIAALGATVLWLSPLNEAPAGDYGYAVTDHFHIRESIGRDDDLRDLVTAAHRRGLRIILDIPANDLSDQHPFYQNALTHGRASRYYDFFERDATGAPVHYFNWTHLENLNYANDAVRSYVMDIFTHWLTDFDVDGFRVDAAWGPRDRAPDFWPLWSTSMHRTKPDVLLLAEASERDPYYAHAGFDAAYDWTDKVGEWAWQSAFDSDAPAARLREALASERHDSLIFRFLDNNDTGRRFVSRHGVPMTKLAATMLMTLPGLPCVFTGEEVSAEFEPYDTTRSIAWHDSDDVGGHLRRLIALRHREPELRSNELSLIASLHPETVLSYLRPGSTPSRDILVLLNFGADPVTLSFSPAELRMLAGAKTVTDILTGDRIMVESDAPTVQLPPLAGRILRREQAP